MKDRIQVFVVLFATVLFASCYNKQKQTNGVKTRKIDRIVMISKGGDGRHNLKKRLVITDNKEINRLSNIFLESKPLERKVNVGANYGSIVIDMLDKDSESVYYLSVIYTVYDGVVIRDGLNGRKFKNDEFVGNVDNLLTDDKINFQDLKNKIEN